MLALFCREQEAVDPAFKALELRQAAEGDMGKNAALAGLTYGMTLLGEPDLPWAVSCGLHSGTLQPMQLALPASCSRCVCNC